MEGLFIQILRLCAEAGLVKVGTVALDGTKIEANASLAANRTQEHIEKEVVKRLAEAEATDKKEDKRYGLDKRGDELPEELRDRRSRLERLKACKQRLEREEEAAHQKQQGKIEKRQAEEELSGKKRRGRKPKEPDAIELNGKKANVTDPDSRIMKTRKGFVQGYNGQAVVTEQQIIVAADVTQEENDVKQLQPMLDEAEQNLQAVAHEEKIGNAVADAGYLSEDNLAYESGDGPTLYIATKKDHQQRSEADEKPIPEGPLPEGLSLRERMEWRLSTKEGKEIYKKRSPMSEGVYGQIKSCRDIRRFVRKGLEACRSEWKLICGTHNLLKLYLRSKACCT